MSKILSQKHLVKFFILLLYFSFTSGSFSQTAKDEIQKLYDQATTIAFVSPDQGVSKFPILNYTSIYGFEKIFQQEEILFSSISGKPLFHVQDITVKTAYFQDIYLQDRYGPTLLNLHPYRGNTLYQPQWPYQQTFAIYKIMLPMTAHLVIDNVGSAIPVTEMHLGLKHDASYSGSREGMIHIFRSTRYDDNMTWQSFPTTDILEIDLPAGEYYLLVSSAPAGMRGTYERGIINTAIHIMAEQSNVIEYNYDQSGNRISRIINIAARTLKVYEQPEQIVSEQIAKRNIRIYSSLKGQATVEFDSLNGMKNGTIYVFSFPNGQRILSRRVHNLREDIDLNHYPSGIYILVVDIDGEKTSYKLMK